jgi:hypothetical protein
LTKGGLERIDFWGAFPKVMLVKKYSMDWVKRRKGRRNDDDLLSF